MSYFAVHVKTGREKYVIDQLLSQAKIRAIDSIKSVIAPFIDVKKFVGKDFVIQKVKMLASSYIYIKIEEVTTEIPAHVYHFLKSVGGVLNVLQYDIPEEDVADFCNNYDLAIEEAEIEIQLENECLTDSMVENQTAQLIHEANMAKTTEEAEQKLEQARNLTRTIDVVRELIRAGKEKNHRLLSKCRAYFHNGRETFKFPLAVYLKTRQRIDPERLLSNRDLTNHAFILPELIKTLKQEVNLV
ncbi:MAG TPA: transcription termination/antitermination NusG family protein [Bacillus sp. (in: firmicutes)]|nr:transcription termination/antitermination NusG family protein [Bacillus sp. (in: firmicutes)]